MPDPYYILLIRARRQKEKEIGKLNPDLDDADIKKIVDQLMTCS